MSAQLVPNLNHVGESDPKLTDDTSSSPPPPIELKPLPIIIANNLHREEKEKLLDVLRQHKKAIGWKLSDLPSINSSIWCIEF
ncbi:hypothetical protein CR513_39064, partial [Mucuna pruriens]